MAETETAPRASRSAVLDWGARLVATGLGSGYSPVAPGTAGSLVGLALFWPISWLPILSQIGLCLALFLVGVVAAGHVARRVGLKDPGLVVADEVLGMWLSVLGLPFTPFVALVGFFLFRILDIVKPYPAADLEHLPGGLGIMADDVAAGLYANLLLRVCLLVWPTS